MAVNVGNIVLTPWPGGDRAVALDALRRRMGLEFEGNIQDFQLENTAKAASERVEHYAPGAPDSVRQEAFYRFLAYLLQAPKSSIRQLTAGSISMTFESNHAAMFRHSGAAALLSPWKVRRAGAIGNAGSD